MGLSFPFPFIDVLTIPTGAGDNDARIVLDGLTGTLTVYDSSGVARFVISTAGIPDITYDGRSYPRGVKDEFVATVNDSARAPGANTDMVFTGPQALTGRRYAIHLHSQINVATAGFNALECTVDGTVVGQFWTRNSPATDQDVDSIVIFEPNSDIAAPVVRVRNNAGSSGNLQLIAGSDNPRRLYMNDEGLLIL